MNTSFVQAWFGSGRPAKTRIDPNSSTICCAWPWFRAVNKKWHKSTNNGVNTANKLPGHLKRKCFKIGKRAPLRSGLRRSFRANDSTFQTMCVGQTAKRNRDLPSQQPANPPYTLRRHHRPSYMLCWSWKFLCPSQHSRNRRKVTRPLECSMEPQGNR